MLYIANGVGTGGGGTGDVVGPIGATDNAIARYNGTTGKLLKNGVVTESDAGDLQAVNSVVFGASPTGTTTQGQMFWDAAEQTVSINVDTTNNVKLSLGTEQYIRVVNKTGVQINDGQVVYISGAQGNRPTASLAKADAFTTSKIIGVATQNIANNAEGFVTTYGEVHGYNTSGFTSGDKLYLSPTVAGALQNTVPSSPNYNVSVATALNSTINGNILVKPEAPIDLDVTLVDNSDLVVASEKAVKTYVDTGLGTKIPTSYLDTDGTLAANSDVKIATQKATKTYVDTMVAGLLDYRGAYNASGNVFPSTGGSGTAGAIMKGDMWIISVAGTLGGQAVQIGDSLISSIDTPGQTAGNWNILNSNISYVPEDVANKSDNTALGTSTTLYPTQNAAKVYADTKALLAGSITQAFQVSQLEIGHATDTSLTRVSAGVAAIEGKNIALNGTGEVLTTGTIELGAASDTTLSRVSAGKIAVEGVNVVTTSSTDTLTNKTLIDSSNVVEEITTTSSSATPTPTGGSLRNFFIVTALATNATFGAPTGTPVNGNTLVIRVTPDATPRTLAFNAIYRAVGVTLPTTTVASKTMYFGCKYNSTASKWDVIAYGIES